MSIDQSKLAAFASQLHDDQVKHYAKDFPGTPLSSVEYCTKVNIKPGRKYTKVDIGGSGKYMVVNETGEIFGIKAYGVIHRGHAYGTLDTVKAWNWGGYTAAPKPVKQPAVTAPVEQPAEPEPKDLLNNTSQSYDKPPARSQEDQKAYDKQTNNEVHQTRKGEALAKLLHLKKNSKGRYDTAWGDKTAKGLYLTIWRVIEEDLTDI